MTIDRYHYQILGRTDFEKKIDDFTLKLSNPVYLRDVFIYTITELNKAKENAPIDQNDLEIPLLPGESLPPPLTKPKDRVQVRLPDVSDVLGQSKYQTNHVAPPPVYNYGNDIGVSDVLGQGKYQTNHVVTPPVYSNGNNTGGYVNPKQLNQLIYKGENVQLYEGGKYAGISFAVDGRGEITLMIPDGQSGSYKNIKYGLIRPMYARNAQLTDGSARLPLYFDINPKNKSMIVYAPQQPYTPQNVKIIPVLEVPLLVNGEPGNFTRFAVV
jgi:hypothetical protein